MTEGKEMEIGGRGEGGVFEEWLVELILYW